MFKASSLYQDSKIAPDSIEDPIERSLPIMKASYSTDTDRPQFERSSLEV
jgi:hypothetical protein